MNCADNYSNKIDCQWIDITGVSFGNYSLRVDANPMRNVSESDWLNNRAVCEIGYFGRGKVTVRGCTTGKRSMDFWPMSDDNLKQKFYFKISAKAFYFL